MKKRILVGVLVATLVITGAFTVTAFAAAPQDGGQGTLQQMWDACRTGNWQGMVDVMRGAQANGYVPCPGVSGGTTSGGTCGAGGCGVIGSGARYY